MSLIYSMVVVHTNFYRGWYGQAGESNVQNRIRGASAAHSAVALNRLQNVYFSIEQKETGVLFVYNPIYTEQKKETSPVFKCRYTQI